MKTVKIEQAANEYISEEHSFRRLRRENFVAGANFVNKEQPHSSEEMFLNMQYYMEYCQMNGYVTPQDWIEKYKHF